MSNKITKQEMYSNLMVKLEQIDNAIKKLEKEIQELKPESSITDSKGSTECLACGKFECLGSKDGNGCPTFYVTSNMSTRFMDQRK